MEETKYKIVSSSGKFWTASGWKKDGRPCVYTEEQLPFSIDEGFYTLQMGKNVEESYYEGPCFFSRKVNIVKVR